MLKLSLSAREQKIVIVLVFVLVLAGMYFGIYRPFLDEQDSIKRHHIVIMRKLKKAKATIRSASMMQENYEDLLQRFKQKESDEQVMSSMLSEIESVARETEIRISDMKPQKVKGLEGYKQFSISLMSDGELNDLLHFIHLMQNEPHSFLFDEMRLLKRSVRSSEINCQMVLTRVLIP